MMGLDYPQTTLGVVVGLQFCDDLHPINGCPKSEGPKFPAIMGSFFFLFLVSSFQHDHCAETCHRTATRFLRSNTGEFRQGSCP